MSSTSCITCSSNVACKHWNILLLSLSLHEYQIISSLLSEMHFWHVWNICWEIIWKYYLHSSKSLIAYKCLRRNFCDVILLQASKKKKKINIIWKNSIQSSNIQFFIFIKMRKQRHFLLFHDLFSQKHFTVGLDVSKETDGRAFLYLPCVWI